MSTPEVRPRWLAAAETKNPKAEKHTTPLTLKHLHLIAPIAEGAANHLGNEKTPQACAGRGNKPNEIPASSQSAPPT